MIEYSIRVDPVFILTIELSRLPMNKRYKNNPAWHFNHVLNIQLLNSKKAITGLSSALN